MVLAKRGERLLQSTLSRGCSVYQLRRSISLFTKISRSKGFRGLLEEFQLWNKDVPKGFEKYFKEGKSKAPPRKETKVENKDPPLPQRSSRSSSKKTSNNPFPFLEFKAKFDPKRPRTPDQNMYYLIGLGVGLLMIGSFLNSSRYREITWKEFINNYLYRGMLNHSEFTMPVLQCPIDGCNWKSQDLDEAFAAALTTALQIHDRTVHPPLAQPANAQVKIRPTLYSHRM
ncbi:AFG3 [Mytilus edulis]|uniref:AFG3 n=1 Tax=Mytilus edulis TaxID=6550 RepID=A0A8S3T435_MYTED|nr:AFG3 [Mytilus edulis]